MIELDSIRIYRGPTPFAADPVVVAALRLANEEGLADACERLRRTYPDWFTDEAPAATGALLAAQTIAHWALGALNEVRGYLHAAGARETNDGIELWVGFHHSKLGEGALRLGAWLLKEAAGPGFGPHTAARRLEAFWKQCAGAHPDWQARVLMQGARTHDIPVLHTMAHAKVWQYGWGSRSRLFRETLSNADGHIATLMQQSKVVTKLLLRRLGMPIPQGVEVMTEEELESAQRSVGFPCVLKPEDRGGGRGVTAGIRDMAQLRAAFRAARQVSSGPLIVETFVEGSDYRLMVLGGKFMAAIRREAASVTGDGERTVAQLLAELNRTRYRNLVKSRYLVPIATDEILLRQLASQGVGLETVLPAGRKVALRSNANRSTGGVTFDETAIVHADVKRQAEMITEAFGLDFSGVDYITRDITQPHGVYIEVNYTPGLAAPIAAGLDPVALATQILGDKPGRIPLRMGVVRAGELAAARDWLRSKRWPEGFGWACGSAAAVDGMSLQLLPNPRLAVEALLLNPRVQQVFVVCSDEELMLQGMLVDRAAEVAVCVALPPEWLAVVKAHSGNVVTLRGWDECASASWGCTPAYEGYEYP